jgi:hypothetical protein
VSEQQFTPDMTVDQAFKVHAGARRVFAGFHLGGCSNCAISESHTIGAVSEDYGIPLPMLLDSLNALFDQAGLTVGDKVRIPDEIRGKLTPPSSEKCASKDWRKISFRSRRALQSNGFNRTAVCER